MRILGLCSGFVVCGFLMVFVALGCILFYLYFRGLGSVSLDLWLTGLIVLVCYSLLRFCFYDLRLIACLICFVFLGFLSIRGCFVFWLFGFVFLLVICACCAYCFALCCFERF